jgi:hypothetical protein
MRTRLAFLAASAAILIGLSASPAGAQLTVLRATLTGAAVPGGGDPTGSGFSYVVVDNVAMRVCAVVRSTQADPAIAVHIHKAPAGQVGPHAIDLNNPIQSGGSSISTGCYSAPRAVIDDLLAHPSNYYVNVHTYEFIAGAVRGQLSTV